MIKTIIFDVGGVLNHVYFKKYFEELEKYSNFTAHEIHKIEKEIRTKLDLGLVNKQDYFEFLKSHINLKMNSEELFNLILSFKKMNFELCDFIKDNLKDKYKLFILSNNSDIFVTKEDRLFYKMLFNKQYYSFEIGIRKPEHKIFEIFLEKENLKAENCLFIDDKENNLLSAQNLNFNVYLFEENQKFFNFIKNNLTQ